MERILFSIHQTPTSIIIIGRVTPLHSLFLKHPNVFHKAGAADIIQMTWRVSRCWLIKSARKPLLRRTTFQWRRFMEICAPVLRRYPSQPDVFHLIISGKIWKKRISSQPVIQNWGDFREQTSQYLNQLTGTTSPDLIFKSLWYQVFSSLFGLKWQVSFKVPTLIRLNFIKRSEDKSWPVREPKYLSN